MSERENTIGDPKPADLRDDGIFDPIPCMIALAGGILACAFLITPKRLQGATRSAHLKWQQRQVEIEQAIGEQCDNIPRPDSPGSGPQSQK
jgi:hypothetical protein